MFRITTPTQLTETLEAIFGSEGLLASLSLDASIQHARELFERTPLKGIAGLSAALPPDWSGIRHDENITLPDRSKYLEAREEFARDVESLIIHGIAPVERGFFSGKYRITFSEFTSGGTGTAAAGLVAAALQRNGYTASVRNERVSFRLDPAASKAINDFMESVAAIDTAREKLGC
ncbi:MAG: hypothetical protein J5J00_08935 [Deltaproteobacteria bacterium]|nr:hypothetical protein [Deltaproteobacteria bacterium]